MAEPQSGLCQYIRGRLANSSRLRQDTGWDQHEDYKATVMGRLDQRLDGWRDGEESHEEFVPLLGQFVRWLGEGAVVDLALWPTQGRPDWQRFGLRLVPVSTEGPTASASVDGLRLQCALDDLDLLTRAQAQAIRRACLQEVAERPPPVVGDSWLLDTEHGRKVPSDRLPTYQTAGQRELLRAVDLLPPGKVLIGTLTTGEGKSLVIHRLITKDPCKLTVVVVPTVALAIDQEIEAREVVGYQALQHPLAYIGGQTNTQAQIRERISDGTQRVVFTCPESLRHLMDALRKVAQDGGLSALVVDEAHVIATDGWQFRPDFAWIPSMCVALSKAATGSATPPRFVLLSATFAQATFDALRKRFEIVGDGEMRVAGSLRLRGEMAPIREQIQAVDAPSDSEQRNQRLQRLLPLLPRPFYIYATRPEHVERTAEMLREVGIRRSDHVHGGTSTGKRREIISLLKRAELDVVSANSAFGLGLNVSHVRAVLHACVPDGLDRYYQEMGRGGRDGRGALAWWLWCESDLEVAKRQAFTKVINQAGFPRWQAMWRNRRSRRGSNCVWVSIGLGENVVTNERHEQWDVCCLVLMEACGLIEFVWDESPPDDVDVSSHICIKKLTADHWESDKEWGLAVDVVRQSIHQANGQAFQRMMEVLRGQSSFWPALMCAYKLRIPGAVAPCCPQLWGDRPSSVPVLLAQTSDSPSVGTHWFVRVQGDIEQFVARWFDNLIAWRPISSGSRAVTRVIIDPDLERVLAPLVRKSHRNGRAVQLQYVHEVDSVQVAHAVRIWSGPTYDRGAWEYERGQARSSLLVLSNRVLDPVPYRNIHDALIGMQEISEADVQNRRENGVDTEDFF